MAEGQPMTATEAMRELEMWRPPAHGCALCGLTITGLGPADPPEDCPRCGDLAGGTIQPLIPIGVARDLLISVREALPVIPADLGRELYEALECFAAAHRQNQSGEYIEDVAAVTVADSRDPWKVAADVVARYEREVGDG